MQSSSDPTQQRADRLLEHWARTAPTAPAVADTLRGLDYHQLATAVERMARWLAARGVRAGDRVCIVAENNVAAVVCFFAAQRLDAWPAIVNARVGAAEIAVLTQYAAPRLTLYAVDSAPAASEAASAVAITETLQDDVFGTVLAGEIEPRSTPEPVYAEAEQQVGQMIFTSGTTGVPKAVMLSHFSLLQIGSILSRSRHARAADTYNGMSPLSHIMGIANVMCALSVGASIRLMPRLDVAALTTGIATGALSQLSFVPTVYARLMEYIGANAIDVSRHQLRQISSAGAQLDPLLKERVEATFKIRLINGYGLTECAPVARTRSDVDSPAASIGWPEQGVRMRIVRDGRDCVDGEIGELWLHSPARMLGYYRREQDTAAVLRPGGWLATGDLAQRLPDGQTAIVGRQKEMIIRSGFNVYPAEVEAALNRLPAVLQSAVVGRKTADYNEEIIAFVQPRPNTAVSEQMIDALLRDSIAPYKRPQRIVLMESLPLGSTGKIWKMKLADMAKSLP